MIVFLAGELSTAGADYTNINDQPICLKRKSLFQVCLLFIEAFVQNIYFSWLFFSSFFGYHWYVCFMWTCLDSALLQPPTSSHQHYRHHHHCCCHHFYCCCSVEFIYISKRLSRWYTAHTRASRVGRPSIYASLIDLSCVSLCSIYVSNAHAHMQNVKNPIYHYAQHEQWQQRQRVGPLSTSINSINIASRISICANTIYFICHRHCCRDKLAMQIVYRFVTRIIGLHTIISEMEFRVCFGILSI